MTDRWYYAKNGQRFGPFSWEQFRQLTRSGMLQPADMVLSEANGSWQSASTVTGLFTAMNPAIVSTGPSSPALRNPLPAVSSRAVIDQPRRPASPPRSALDIVLSVLALLSLFLWLLGIGTSDARLCFVGPIWLFLGIRALSTGQMVDFNGRLRRSRWYRVGGAFLAVTGLLFLYRGVHEVIVQASTLAATPVATRSQEAASAFRRARQQEEQGEVDQAILSYTSAIELDASRFEFLNNRGLLYARQKQYARSIADFSQAIQRLANGPQTDLLAGVYYDRGLSYALSQQYEQAIADFTEAVRLQPGMTKAYHNRGLCYRETGDRERARADFERADRQEHEQKAPIPR